MIRAKISALVLATSLVGLGACTQSQGTMTEQEQRTAAGAVIGGVAGAVAGTHIAGDGNRTTGAIIGGVTGAAAGAAIGNTM